MTQYVVPAPAKLNLFLHVLGRREDGYHLLESIFQFIDWGDTLTLTLRQDGVISRSTELLGVAAEQDLCVRAARLLQRASACQLGVDIALDKHLPMGGGLGGGSSDAASVLITLNRLWGLNWSRERLQSLALQLGADVPVFIFGQNAFAQGVGEKLQAVCLEATWYVVLIPPVTVPTAVIFSHHRLTRDTKSIKILDFLDPLNFSKSEVNNCSVKFSESGNKNYTDVSKLHLSLARIAGMTQNDLQAVACLEFPVIQDYIQYLSRFAPARMTGSGACVFAGFATELSARQALSAMPDVIKGFVVRGLERHPLYAWCKG